MIGAKLEVNGHLKIDHELWKFTQKTALKTTVKENQKQSSTGSEVMTPQVNFALFLRLAYVCRNFVRLLSTRDFVIHFVARVNHVRISVQ